MSEPYMEYHFRCLDRYLFNAAAETQFNAKIHAGRVLHLISIKYASIVHLINIIEKFPSPDEILQLYQWSHNDDSITKAIYNDCG